MRTATALTGAAALLLSGLAAPSAALTAADPPVDSRVGTLTSRPAGLPSTSTPARQLASAQVRQQMTDDRVSGTFTLRAAPAAASSSTLVVGFGLMVGSSCEGEKEWRSPVTGTLAPGFSRSGATLRLGIAEDEASYQDWNCSYVALVDTAAPATTYDALVGTLSDVPATPRLRVGQPTVLDKPVSRLKLVRNAWTTVRVPVHNDGRVDAERVRVTARGKGLRVKGVADKVWAGSERTLLLQVKRVAARSGPLRITASTAGAPGARRTLRTASVNPPPRPKPGTYRNQSGTVTFRITAGRTPRIKGFRVRTRTTCGGYPSLPTYSMNYYTFPTSPIGGGGVVDRSAREELYTVSLSLRAVGRRVTSARFDYNGPARCRATETFTATRRR